jgi:hypothetical protein
MYIFIWFRCGNAVVSLPIFSLFHLIPAPLFCASVPQSALPVAGGTAAFAVSVSSVYPNANMYVGFACVHFLFVHLFSECRPLDFGF